MITLYAPEHLFLIDAQPEQVAALEATPWPVALAMAGPNSWSLWRGSTLVACAGIVQAYGHCGEAWAVLSRHAGRHLVTVDRLARSIIAASPFTRVTTYVKCDFPAGHRWIKSLGFECEAPRCVQAGPEKADYALYALVR